MNARDISELILHGDPIPDRYRLLISQVVAKHSPLNQVLLADRYIQLGYGRSQDSVFRLASSACFRSPATVETNYQKLRQYIEE